MRITSTFNYRGNGSKHGRIGASNFNIGRFTYGIQHVNVKQWGEGASLTIGSFVAIAENLTIYLGGNHRTEWASTFPFGLIFDRELPCEIDPATISTKGDVKIGSDCWIGSHVTIMSGVEVGHGSVIAAGTYLAKSVNPYSFVAGNPGRLKSYRFAENIIEQMIQLGWWDLPTEEIIAIAPLLRKPPTMESISQIYSKLEEYRTSKGL